MKGIILAGGTGSRLMPLTAVVNKNLLPVYDRPMLYYLIQTMVQAGITEILVVTGGKTAGDVMRVLGDGSELGLTRLYFAFQQHAAGIPDALAFGEEFAAEEKICCILGDNLVFGTNLGPSVRDFEKSGPGARVFLKAVHDPERFGIAEVQSGRIVSVEEKPAVPKSNLAVTGLYLYDNTVFDRIRGLVPSRRGELEVTDLNQTYLEEGTLGYSTLDGEWIDAGTFDSLIEAGLMARRAADHRRLTLETAA